MKIAIATCVRLPEPDPDQERLLCALRQAGATTELFPWDGLDVADLSGFDVCVIRSTWNYVRAYDDFLAWVDRASRLTLLRNGAEIVRWNSHKGYLRDLDVPTVPTVFVDRHAAVPAIEEVFEAFGTEELVIKPSVSAGSYLTRRFRIDESAAAAVFLADLSGARDAMIQPFVRSVDTVGEHAIVWIAGEVTHAIRKNPRFDGEHESVSLVADVPPALEQLARDAIGHLADELLYGRVDVMADDDGQWRISELELIEPSLFFAQAPWALERFVNAIVEGGP